MKLKLSADHQTLLPLKTFLLLTCRFCCLSRVHEASFLSEEPEMPLRRSVSKVRHMTGSAWALAELTLDLCVTSHSNREPSSYPASRRGPEAASVWSRGRMIREKMKTKRREDVNVEWKTVCGAVWSRGYHPGSSCWHARILWAPFISLLCSLQKFITAFLTLLPICISDHQLFFCFKRCWSRHIFICNSHYMC